MHEDVCRRLFDERKWKEEARIQKHWTLGKQIAVTKECSALR